MDDDLGYWMIMALIAVLMVISWAYDNANPCGPQIAFNADRRIKCEQLAILSAATPQERR